MLMSAFGTQQTLRRNHFTVESVRSDFIGDGHVVCKRSPTEIQMANQVWCKQATKGFYWLMMPGMRTLHKKVLSIKKGTRTLTRGRTP